MGATWLFDDAGQLSAHWQALPALTIFTAEVAGFTAFGDFADDFTELSRAFVAATGPTSTLLDTSIPGFEPDWIVDYHSQVDRYTRTQLAQNVTNLVTPEQAPIFTSDIIEIVFPPAAIASRAAAAALQAQPQLPRLPGMPYPR